MALRRGHRTRGLFLAARGTPPLETAPPLPRPPNFPFENWYGSTYDTHVYYHATTDDPATTDADFNRATADAKTLKQEDWYTLIGEWALCCASDVDSSLRTDDFFRDFARSQLTSYEQGGLGWYYWSYKTASSSTWHFRAQCEKERLPNCGDATLTYAPAKWWGEDACVYDYLHGCSDETEVVVHATTTSARRRLDAGGDSSNPCATFDDALVAPILFKGLSAMVEAECGCDLTQVSLPSCDNVTGAVTFPKIYGKLGDLQPEVLDRITASFDQLQVAIDASTDAYTDVPDFILENPVEDLTMTYYECGDDADCPDGTACTTVSRRRRLRFGYFSTALPDQLCTRAY